MKNINKITTHDTSPLTKSSPLYRKGSKGKEYGQAGLQAQIKEAYKGFENIDYKSNLWGGAQNQFADAENKYSNLENKYEDLTVNQQQAQFQAQQGAQQRSNIMGSLKGAAGGSGVAGLAQAMANQGQLATQQASASIGQQESANRMASAGAASANQMAEAQGATAAQTQQMQGASDTQKIILQGSADAKNRELQVQQGKLSFLSGQLDAANANEDADYRKGQNFWSDRRLKKNISLIGKSSRGLNIYSFEYKNPIHGDGVFQGVMSDEVPGYAVINNNGYDMVDYSVLDVEFKNI
jgi:hypothetical protein